MANPFVHVELHTQDPEKAKKFYKELICLVHDPPISLPRGIKVMTFSSFLINWLGIGSDHPDPVCLPVCPVDIRPLFNPYVSRCLPSVRQQQLTRG
jgi:hypothetical protein